jgi:hypothetical protein
MVDIVNMTLGELVGWAAVGAAALSTVVQISPIKINPWSALAGWVGRAINGEVIKEVASLKDDIKAVKADIEGVKAADAERDAKAARARILQFGDELIENEWHTKEHFDDVLQDIDDYEAYCRDHADFKNNRTHATTQYILEVYHRCLKEHRFALSKKGDE